MKKHVIFSFYALLWFVFFSHSTQVSAQNNEQKVVVHLSKFTNDLHAANMALKIGTALAEKGASVMLFLDLEGVRLVDKRQPNDMTWGSGDSVKALYEDFVNSGGTVMVCPHCANAAGLTPDDLRTGAKIGSNDSIAQMILDADKVMDY